MDMNFCNCKPNNPEQYTNKFRVVDADKDGVCLNCGHYTLSTDKEHHYISNVNGLKYNKRNTTHSQEVVDSIKDMLRKGIKGKIIAEKLGVSQAMVSSIKNNKSRV